MQPSILLIILIFINFYFPQLKASEKLGVLVLDDILMRPHFLVREGQETEFGLGETSMAFSWSKDQSLSAKIRLGPESLINPMIFLKDEISEQLTMIEAYAQLIGVYGRLRMGLIPLEFGVEGRWRESEIHFSRSLLFEKRIVPLRDYGFSYYVSNKGFYTQMAVHNGEGESRNPDSRMFFTASWGWRNQRNFEVGVSALTGTTKPQSTQAVNNSFLAGANVNVEALWRMAQGFLHWHPNNWFFLMEVLFGELEQVGEITKFNTGHIDLGYRWSPFIKIMARYDHLDPHAKIDRDLQRRASLGLMLSDKHQSQALYLIASKNYEQGSNLANDEFRLIWRMTPFYSGEN